MTVLGKAKEVNEARGLCKLNGASLLVHPTRIWNNEFHVRMPWAL